MTLLNKQLRGIKGAIFHILSQQTVIKAEQNYFETEEMFQVQYKFNTSVTSCRVPQKTIVTCLPVCKNK